MDTIFDRILHIDVNMFWIEYLWKMLSLIPCILCFFITHLSNLKLHLWEASRFCICPLITRTCVVNAKHKSWWDISLLQDVRLLRTICFYLWKQSLIVIDYKQWNPATAIKFPHCFKQTEPSTDFTSHHGSSCSWWNYAEYLVSGM